MSANVVWDSKDETRFAVQTIDERNPNKETNWWTVNTHPTNADATATARQYALENACRTRVVDTLEDADTDTPDLEGCRRHLIAAGWECHQATDRLQTWTHPNASEDAIILKHPQPS